MNASIQLKIAIAALAGVLVIAGSVHADTPAPTSTTAADYRKLAATAETAGDHATAIADYAKASDLDKATAPSDAADDQMQIGGIYDAQSQSQKAIDAYTTGLDLYTTAKYPGGEAYALRRRGRTYTTMLAFDKAEADETQALTLDHAAKDGHAEGYDLYNLGEIRTAQKRPSDAEIYYRGALDLFLKAQDVDFTVYTLNKIGAARWDQHKYKDAQTAYLAVAAVCEKLTRPLDAGVAFENVGNLYMAQQDWGHAKGSYLRAKAIFKTAKSVDDEAESTKLLADALIALARFPEAIDTYTEARKLNAACGDTAGEIECLLGVAGTYSGMTQTRMAIPLEIDLIAKARTMNRPDLLARGLTFYAQDLICSGKSQEAFANLDEAHAIAVANPDYAYMLSGIDQNYGMACEELNRYSEAVNYFHKAYADAGKIKDANSQGRVLICLGYVFERINQHHLAIDTQHQAIALLTKTKDPEAVAIAQLNIAFSYNALGRYKDGIALFQTALKTTKRSGVDDDSGRCLAYISEGYYHLGDNKKALAYLNRAMPYVVKVDDKELLAMVNVDLGIVNLGLGQFDKANRQFQSAVILAHRIGSREREASALSGLMKVASQQKRTTAAVFFGKQAVSCYQQIRGNIVNLGNKSQSSYLIAHADTYRTLAEMLISMGRLPEAQQILNMLKVDEFKDFVRRDAADASAPDAAVDYRSNETDWRKRYDKIADQITALGVRFEELQARKRAAAEGAGTFTAADDADLKSTGNDLDVASQAFNDAIEEITNESNLTVAQNRTLGNLEDTTALAGALKKMGPGTVALYTIIEPDKYRVLVITSQTQKAEQYVIPATEINAKVLQFRDLLQNPKLDPRPLAKELYDILIGPIEKDLAGAKAKVLMWSLDGTLRYLPIAALYDGSHYLVERYGLSVFTPASMTRLGDAPQAKWTGLGLGVSKPHAVTDPTTKQVLNFNPLPGARAELAEVMGATSTTNRIMPGMVLLDEAFTRDTMVDTLRGGNYAVVHIASHFAFRPGHDSDSFLLLGDGSRLTLADFKTLRNIFQGTDLLTLSACQTAVGDVGADGKEVEGLGVEAQRQGAEAVMASLWSVDDNSTQMLMQDFYHIRETVTGVSKAESLRQAQLMLIHGSPTSAPAVPITPTAHRGTERADEDPAQNVPALPFKKNPKAPYAHPYYWAPFILIGNWK